MNRIKQLFVVMLALCALATGGVVYDVTTAGPAQAAPNMLCHKGGQLNPAMQVLEADGSKYLVYPGQCTPGDVSIFGMRPLQGTIMYYRREGSTTLRRCDYIYGQWCSTLNRNITVTSVRYGF